jgi:tetratricopeptide (TPR) repeat protein
MRAWLGVVLLFAAAAVAAAAAADQPPDAVADHYEQVIARSGYSAPALFDLGNAWLRSGRPGRAILEYERALVLAPGNPAIEANLAAARQRAGVTPSMAGPWLTAARSVSFDSYLWLGLGALWVLCVALVLLCLNGRPRRLAKPLVLAAVVTLCASADAAALCWSDLYRAVVQGPATLRVAPAASAASIGGVRDGEVVWIQQRYAGFNLVRTAEGRSGWVSADSAMAVRESRP